MPITKLIDLGNTSPANFKAATSALGNLRRFAEFAESRNPVNVAAGLKGRESEQVRQMAATCRDWLARLAGAVQ